MKYLLTVVDIFSFFYCSFKTENWTISCKYIFKDLKEERSSKRLVDKSREFYNKDVQNKVDLYSTENEEKSRVIERFNRTIKEKRLSISLPVIQENVLIYLTY